MAPPDINFASTIQLLDSTLSPYAVYLFGSGARSQLRTDSDIDLAFLSDRSISMYELFLLEQQAALLLNLDVDLIDLRVANTVFQAQIVGTGKLLVSGDPARVAEFQMRVLKDYALLNDERACIFKAIEERGSIYAE